MAETNKKVANSLVALSSAAVLAVYSAGYVRTRAAADRFALLAADRRPGSSAPVISEPRATVQAPAPVPPSAAPPSLTPKPVKTAAPVSPPAPAPVPPAEAAAPPSI